jgi:hypothetical protein
MLDPDPYHMNSDPEDPEHCFQPLILFPCLQVNEDLMKAGKAFSQWGRREVEVLASLPKCGSLLAWLATNIRDRSDLKTFYDLATIAAGESDHELDRVTHFYQVH